jgi:hypothetical protein
MNKYDVDSFASELIKFLIPAIFLIQFVSSCERGPVFQEFYDPFEYFPIEVGNYWVYKSSYTTTDGTITSTGVDTIWVIGDTTIYGTKYYRLKGSWMGGRPYHELLRYVLGERVMNPQGKIWYQGSKFGENINSYASFNGRDTTYSERFYMFEPENPVDIGLGTFETVALKGVYREPQQFDGPVMISEWHYAFNIGLVKAITDYLQEDYFIEMELVDYRVQ